MKFKHISLLVFLALLVSNYMEAQITVSEYTRAMKVDANNVPPPNVEFTSTCGEVDVEVSEKMASGGCLGNIIRTYSATDNCGNSANAEQYLSLQDNKGPELFGVPKDLTVENESDVPEAPVVGAKDLGDRHIEVTLSESKQNNTLTRTWSAKDRCGNKSEAYQVITINNVQSKKKS